MAAMKVKFSDTAVSIRVNAGRTKGYADTGEPADLSAAQIKELLAAAPDPAKASDSKK